MSDDIYYKHWRDIRNKCPNIYFGKNREEQDSLFSRNPISLMICEALCENLPEASLPDYLFSRSFYEGNFFEKSFHQLPEEIRNGIIQHRKEDIFEMKLCDIDETNGCEPLYWKFAVSVPLGGATPEDIQKVVKAFEAELRAKTTGRTDSKRYMLESIIGSPEAWDALIAYEQAKDHYADKLEQMDSDTRVEKLDRYAWDQSRFQGQEPRRFNMLKEQRDKIMNETSEEGLVFDIYPDLKLGGYKHAS